MDIANFSKQVGPKYGTVLSNPRVPKISLDDLQSFYNDSMVNNSFRNYYIHMFYILLAHCYLHKRLESQEVFQGAEEIAQRLRTLANFPEDLGLNPGTHMVAPYPCSSSSRKFDALFQPLQEHAQCTDKYADKSTHRHTPHTYTTHRHHTHTHTTCTYHNTHTHICNAETLTQDLAQVRKVYTTTSQAMI